MLMSEQSRSRKQNQEDEQTMAEPHRESLEKQIAPWRTMVEQQSRQQKGNKRQLQQRKQKTKEEKTEVKVRTHERSRGVHFRLYCDMPLTALGWVWCGHVMVYSILLYLCGCLHR